MDDQEIDIHELMSVVLKRKMLIIFLALSTVLVSLIINSFVITPIYEAHSTLLVGKHVDGAQIVYQDIQLNRQLVKTYGEIAKSNKVALDIIEELDLSISPESLKSKINVSQVLDTEIITISVRDESPEHAAFLANGVARVFIRHVMEIMNTDNVSIIDPAVAPTSKISPQPIRNTVLAAIVALITSLFLALLCEYLDNSIKTPRDVEKYLDLPLLGSIPDQEREQRRMKMSLAGPKLGKREHKGYIKNIVSIKQPKSLAAEAYRTIRTNIEFSGFERELKTLLLPGWSGFISPLRRR